MTDWESILRGRFVVVTGHTGFTGTWLCLWLKQLGCEIAGISLQPDTSPSIYELTGLEQELASHIQDICVGPATISLIRDLQPDCIFHLAAQPLVRRAYREPIWTLQTNIMGTAHVLEAARSCTSVKAVVCVTSDKVYCNREWLWPYRETDRLGGIDPYSASKSAAEFVIDSYREVLGPQGKVWPCATARGGNIIGGGDWSEDRIIPDFVRAITRNEKLVLRNPAATRPWQHVLSAVHGYLLLGAKLLDAGTKYGGAWNFGPEDRRPANVRQLVEGLAKHWTAPELEFKESSLKESRFLAVDSSRARQDLGWNPPWSADEVLQRTADWYRRVIQSPGDARLVSNEQLECYRSNI